jgi:hypothetical protein
MELKKAKSAITPQRPTRRRRSPIHQIRQMRVRARTVEFASATLADVITSGTSAA